MGKSPSILIVFLICVFSSIKAQQKNSDQIKLLKGKVMSNGPLSSSTISVLNATDSSLYLQVITDTSGLFKLNGNFIGNFILSVSHVGYTTYYSPVFNPDSTDDFVNPFNIQLFKKESQLVDIEIKKSQQILERKLDRLIINVENNILGTGESLLELLRTLPGISVDGSENLLIKGKTDIRVMVDGRESYFKGEQLKILLTTMSSNDVQKVEIISNPPANYAAEGAGGIINIITKVKYIEGSSGNITSTYSQGVYGRYLLGGFLTYKKKNITLTTSYDFTYSKGFTNADEIRKFLFGYPPLVFHQTSSNITSSINQYFKVGVDWTISPKQNIAVFIDIASSEKRNPFYSTLFVSKDGLSIDSSFSVNNFSKPNYFNTNFNINYTLQSNSNQSLEVNYSSLLYNDNTASNYHSLFYNKNQQSTYPPMINSSFNKSTIFVNAFKVDFKKVLWANIQFSSGLKYTSTNSDNDIKFYSIKNAQAEIDSTKSNHFIYNENIAAAYISAEKKLTKYDIQLGFRFENTEAKLNLIPYTGIIYRHLNNLFPTLYIEYKFNDSNKFNFNSGRRIKRPGYSDLNPFEFYYDPYSYEKGNPLLLPEFSITNEISYTFKEKYTISLGYSSARNLINEITIQDTVLKTVAYQYENISKSKNIYLETYLPIRITKWWNSNADLNFSYTQINGNSVYGNFSNKLAGVNFNYSNTFSVAKFYLIQANIFYASPFLDGISVFKGRGRLAFAIKRSFFKKNVSVSIKFNDVLLTDKQRLQTTSLQENIYLQQFRDSRRIGLTIIYNFKKGNSFKERSFQFGGQEEKGRMNIIPKTN